MGVARNQVIHLACEIALLLSIINGCFNVIKSQGESLSASLWKVRNEVSRLTAICEIGCCFQTMRHRPEFDTTPPVLTAMPAMVAASIGLILTPFRRFWARLIDSQWALVQDHA